MKRRATKTSGTALGAALIVALAALVSCGEELQSRTGADAGSAGDPSSDQGQGSNPDPSPPGSLDPFPGSPGSTDAGAPATPGADAGSGPSVDSSASPFAEGGQEVTSVSQYGITWTFASPAVVGQFVTGDYWVVGPVTIKSVSPTPQDGRNGSVVNPVPGEQGYDSRGGNWAPATQASFPLALKPGDALASTVSNPEPTECNAGGSNQGWKAYNGTCRRGVMKAQAALTVVTAPLAADVFRPPYAGTGFRPLHQAGAIQWQLLPKLAAPAEAPTGSTVLRWFERPRMDHQNSWKTQHVNAIDNFPGYGREISNEVSMAALHVMLDTPERQELARRLIQLGIDTYGVLKAGGFWPADGGHASGRKWPVLLAGILLGDPAMTAAGKDYKDKSFGEDCQTYYDSSGVPRWGIRHCYKPDSDNESSGYRTCCTSHTWVGTMLAALMLNAKSVWDHDPYFDYVDRWIKEGGDYGGTDKGKFISQMWQAHRNNLP